MSKSSLSHCCWPKFNCEVPPVADSGFCQEHLEQVLAEEEDDYDNEDLGDQFDEGADTLEDDPEKS